MLLSSKLNPKVEIVDFDSNWSSIFQEESIRIKDALGPNCLLIHHIGSTSIEGMGAKPIIDMIPVVSDIRQVDTPSIGQRMNRLGYIGQGEHGLPFRRFFWKSNPLDPTRRLFHLHVYQEQNPEIQHHLAVRNYLRESPEVALRYLQLKRHLALTYPDDMNGYCLEKGKFILEIGPSIPFSGLLLRDCYTHHEWKEFKRILGINGGEEFIPDENQFHFVLYRGISKVIGAAHLSRDLEIIQMKSEEDEFRSLLDLWKKQKMS